MIVYYYKHYKQSILITSAPKNEFFFNKMAIFKPCQRRYYNL